MIWTFQKRSSTKFIDYDFGDGVLRSAYHSYKEANLSTMNQLERSMVKKVSSMAHDDLKNMILNSKTFDEFKVKLNKWANLHLEITVPGPDGKSAAVKGRNALLEALRVSNELNVSPREVYNK